ncbi:MAG: Rne/Rng family ribonuclease [Actinomycetota bacterium]
MNDTVPTSGDDNVEPEGTTPPAPPISSVFITADLQANSSSAVSHPVAMTEPSLSVEAVSSPALPPSIGAVLFQAPEFSPAPPRQSQPASTKDSTGSDDYQNVVDSQDSDTQSGRVVVAEESTLEPDDAVGTDVRSGRRRRRRGGRSRQETDSASEVKDSAVVLNPAQEEPSDADGISAVTLSEAQESEAHEDESPIEGVRQRRKRKRSSAADESDASSDDEVSGVRGSTRLEAKKQRRRDGREHRRSPVITEAEFLARRESVRRRMLVRERSGRTQIAVLEDDVLVEHYVADAANASMIGNIYLGRVQNVLPSMEAAFVDIGRGRNAVLYAGEVNWDAAGLEGQPRRIEAALSVGDHVLAQITKDPIGHKGARLTSQISLPGRYLVYVPNGSMTGISRKLPDTERFRLKKILKAVVPEDAGVIVRTAAEGASEVELRRDIERLAAQWDEIQLKASAKTSGKSSGGPILVHGEPDLTVRVIRDVFNEDFTQLVVSGETAWEVIQPYVSSVAPDLTDRVTRWTDHDDIFIANRIDEQLAKALDRKVWLPSGGSLVIDRTEAMTVVDVNTGKYTGSGGNLEETVTRNNLEAAEEIVRQLRLRDIGGIIVIDFIDMVLEANRSLVLRRLMECLGRDRTKHQVAEVTSLGLVQMTRKRIGQGLLEVFGETCESCQGRGVIVRTESAVKSNGGSNNRWRNSASSRAQAASATTPDPVVRQPIPAGLVASLTHSEETLFESEVHGDSPEVESSFPKVSDEVPDVLPDSGLVTEKQTNSPMPVPSTEALPVPQVQMRKPRTRRRAFAPAGPPTAAPAAVDSVPDFSSKQRSD